MLAVSLERIGLITAGAGAGALILTKTGLAPWALLFGALAAIGGYAYQRWG